MAKKRYYGGMINDDTSAIANLPQQVIYKKYPEMPYNMPEGLDDTMAGVDRQIKDDLKRKKPINSEKY